MKINSNIPGQNITKANGVKTVKEENPLSVADKVEKSSGQDDGGLIKDLKNLSQLSKGMEASAETKVDEHPEKAIYFKTTQHDQYNLDDGFDSSRDIVAFGAKEGGPSDPYQVRIKFRDLQPGAELGNLDTYLLIETGEGGKNELPDGIKGKTTLHWNLAVGAYDNNNINVYDEKGKIEKEKLLKSLKYDTDTNSLEMEFNKDFLREKGWKDHTGMIIQMFTTKDNVPKITDSLDRAPEKPWVNNNTLTRELSTNPWANPRKIEDWPRESIYFVLTDRFNDGDQTNNINVDKKDLGKFHGGDLQGVIDKLDYLSEIGTSSIWLSPTMENQDFFVHENNAGYHYYWPVDFFKVDKRQGDMGKFKELIDKAHEKDIKILLDIPLNHTAWEHPFKKDPDKHDWFHHIGDVQNWEDPYEAENGSIFGLPDLAQENPEVYKYLMDVAKFWMDTGIDGFRLDAVKNISMPFWQKFNREVHQYAAEKLDKPDFFLVGECFDTRVDKVNAYQKEDMDSLFAYPEKFVAHEVLAHDGSMRKLAAIVDEGNKKYQSPDLMTGFIDNHDTERFLSASGGDKRKLQLALDFLYTVNRIPKIYYGTEVGMDATPPPGSGNVGWPATSRKDMEWAKDPETLDHFKKVSSIRNNSEAIRNGDFVEMWVDDQVYSYGRNHILEEVVVVLNNSHDNQERDIPLRADNKIIKDGTVLVDMLTGEKVTVKNGKVHASVPAKKSRIYKIAE